MTQPPPTAVTLEALRPVVRHAAAALAGALVGQTASVLQEQLGVFGRALQLSRVTAFRIEAGGTSIVAAWYAPSEDHPDAAREPPTVERLRRELQQSGEFRPTVAHVDSVDPLEAERMRARGAAFAQMLPLAAGDALGGAVALVDYHPRAPHSEPVEHLLMMWAGLVGQAIARIEAEAAMRASESRYRRLAQASRDGVILHTDGVIEDVNEAAARMMGRPVDAIVGRSVFDFLPAELHERIRQRWQAGDTEPLEIEARSAAGEELPVEVEAGLVDGGPMRVVTVRDLRRRRAQEAARRALEQRVLEAQKLESLGVLAGGVAHDFNNLLVGILGNADFARSELPRDHPASEPVAQIRIAAQRAAELTEQLLAYAGRGRIELRLVNVGNLVQEMAGLLRASIPRKVRLDVRLQRCGPVFADPSQLRQVVMNLVVNAGEAYAGEPGVVEVALAGCTLQDSPPDLVGGDRLPPGDYLLLRIADRGQGMTQDVLDRIFEPFFTTKFTGRGLGLAAVVGIVRGCGGGIAVASRAREGTAFSVFLPSRDGTPPPELNSLPRLRSKPASGTILIVDDEPVVRHLAARVLEREGYTVLTAADGRRGLQTWREHRDDVDLVLLDLTMPELSGEEVHAALVAEDPDVAVLFTSGHSEPEYVSRAIADGRATFVRKPFRVADLLAAVAGMTDRG